MRQTYLGAQEHGANEHHDADERGRPKLSASLQIPKNRSTGNLAVIGESSDRGRIRFSFDAGAATAEFDGLTRSPIMTDHDHGLGLSGLRRIRQHHPVRAPTLPSSSNPSSRSPSVSLPRSASMMTLVLPHACGSSTSLSPGPASPTFTEDLSRFPSESLHSFSFANQSEELIHSRQSVLKRSLEFMRDRMGWAAANANNAAIASAQARVSGDHDAQSMLELLAKANIVGAGNLPNPDPAVPHGPLTGPAEVSGENVFDREFIPRSTSPDQIAGPAASAATAKASPSTHTSAKQAAAPGARPSPSVSTGAVSPDSADSSRTPTNESGGTDQTSQSSPPPSRRPSVLKRALTDTAHASMQQKLVEAMAQPYVPGVSSGSDPVLSPNTAQSFSSAGNFTMPIAPAVHGHSTRWVPAAQAIFTTEAKPPWTIVAANDLACLVFGVTKAEVRKMGILEVVQEERRDWLSKKLQGEEPGEAQDVAESEAAAPPKPAARAVSNSLLGSRGGGITAHLLSKPNSRTSKAAAQQASRRPQAVQSGDPRPRKTSNNSSSTSRGVLLCGDVVPIQKRNGATGSASLWVKEKRVGFIWVLEEIHEDVATITLGEEGIVEKLDGALAAIWGDASLKPGMDVGKLIPRIPRQGIDPRTGEIDYAQLNKRRFYTCRNSERVSIPATVEQTRGKPELRVSSFPHIAGIIVVNTNDLKIKSSNSVFCGALFGHEKPDGMPISNLVPDFDKLLEIITREDDISLVDGIVVPEHSFRRASAFLALRDGRGDTATSILRPEGLPGRHRDGSELKIDIQMRVVQSEKQAVTRDDSVLEEEDEDEEGGAGVGAAPETSWSLGGSREDVSAASTSEMVYALWITYSRHLHTSSRVVIGSGATSPLLSGTNTPLHQPSPGQTPAHTPQEIGSDTEEPKKEMSIAKITQQIKDVARGAAAKIAGGKAKETAAPATPPAIRGPEPAATPTKKTIDSFTILEEMGQGAYGQVKLAKYKDSGHKVVLKYVTKRRILVDTWTRDRRLGTVPLEIHVLDYLRRDGLRHPNIVEMEDFFEDETNYYIEMAPHGLPGMDLFDYIELRSNMEESECRSIFVQVARAIHHLHTKANVVHRDIKDENVILDGDGNIKLIDFGSAAYIKSGPFDVFVGTIDYAAPEVLGGKPYGGKEQDVWALGILLYTIIYKENPFYSIDEIMDRDLRVPYTISDESIDLIRQMLNRDVSQRFNIDQVLAHAWCQEPADNE
ncbi:hypothetical protein RB595_005611 [Gaeumannomyces hyphopodioides]